MDIKTLILLTYPILFSHWSCIPSDSGTVPNSRNSATCPEGSELNSAGTGCEEVGVKQGDDPFADDPFGNLEDERDLIPNYDTANLDSRFNRRNIATLNIPEEFETASIIAKRSEFHRRIWWDLRGGARRQHECIKRRARY